MNNTGQGEPCENRGYSKLLTDQTQEQQNTSECVERENICEFAIRVKM